VKTRDIAVVALAAGLSTALSFLRLYEMPQGGSVTLDPLPIFYVALWLGATRGIAAGVLAGLLQLIIHPIVVHPIQMLLDYPLAMAAPAIAGFFRRPGATGGIRTLPAVAGVLAGSAAKFCCHLVSGVVFFGMYAPAGQNVWLYSAIYNGSYVVPQAILSMLLLPPILRRATAG